MIEAMINKTKQHLPLSISDITWDGTVFNMYGEDWSFTTLSAWRITENNKMVFGCYDKLSSALITHLKEFKIVNIATQELSLKIDPVFMFSNKQRLEIFSTDTYEPWTFNIHLLGFFSATPSEPEAFIE